MCEHSSHKNLTNQPCWNCKNFVDGCSWSREFTPVEGWIAKPTVKAVEGNIMESYEIIFCPEFVNDGTLGIKYVDPEFKKVKIDGKKLKNFIKQESGLTLTDFCKAADVSGLSLSNYIREVYYPKQSVMTKIANYFGMEYEDFMELLKKEGE